MGPMVLIRVAATHATGVKVPSTQIMSRSQSDLRSGMPWAMRLLMKKNWTNDRFGKWRRLDVREWPGAGMRQLTKAALRTYIASRALNGRSGNGRRSCQDGCRARRIAAVRVACRRHGAATAAVQTGSVGSPTGRKR